MNTRHRTLFRLVVEKNPERTFTQQVAELILGLSKPETRVTRAYPPPAKKTIPTFQNDEEAENFVATADLSEYDLSGGTVAHFEIEKSEDAYWAKKAEEGVNSGFLGQSETRKFIKEKMTLDKAIETTFAQNSEVKKHYNEMEEEYQIKAQNIEEATQKGNKRRGSR